MQATIIDSLTVLFACLIVAIAVIGFFVLRPARRRHRHRHRKRHSHRPKIDLFSDKAADPAPTSDA